MFSKSSHAFAITRAYQIITYISHPCRIHEES